MGKHSAKRMPFWGSFWGKTFAGFVCAAVALTAAGEYSVCNYASGETTIQSLEAKAKQIAEENEARQKEIDGLDGDISKNKDLMALVNKQIDGIIGEIDAYSSLISAKQQDIDQKLIDIANVEENIAGKEKEISDKQTKISQLQAENKKSLEKFGKLARYMYMNNASSQIPVLNGSDDWYDYFVYSDVVKNISGQNYAFMMEIKESIKKQEDMIIELNGEIAALETEKADLKKQKETYESDAALLAKEKVDLEAYTQQKRGDLSDLAAENASFQQKIDGLEQDIADANAEREALNAQIEELIRQQQAANKESDSYVDYSGDGFRWPLNPSFHAITTYFGYDAWRGGMHRGIDVGDGGIAGTDILAAQSGTVISVVNYCSHNYGKNYSCGCGGGYGNYIIVDHGGGISTVYAHCSAIYVSEGQHVEKGQAIAAVGTTGWSTGNHLHFEVRENGVAVNPFNYVSY